MKSKLARNLKNEELPKQGHQKTRVSVENMNTCAVSLH